MDTYFEPTAVIVSATYDTDGQSKLMIHLPVDIEEDADDEWGNWVHTQCGLSYWWMDAIDGWAGPGLVQLGSKFFCAKCKEVSEDE
jgi:hypothetical protein